MNNLLFMFYMTMFALAYVDIFHFCMIIYKNKKFDNDDDDDNNNQFDQIFDDNDDAIKKQLEKKNVRYEDKYLELLRQKSNDDIDYNIPEKNKIIIEHTPLGNVAMWYDKKTESFHYNSDSTIPYRFLEVVARKYVIQYQCRELYVDMEEEIKSIVEKRQQQKEKEKQEKEQQEIEREEKQKMECEAKSSSCCVGSLSSNANNNNKPKTSVFAKFKDYNKATTKSSAAAPNKGGGNSSSKKEGEESSIVLKDNSNRYTYDGRFSNFQPLIKIDRKLTNKRLVMTFADFKSLKF